MEYFDIVDIQGKPTGERASRADVHKYGYVHRAVHIWIYRMKNKHYELLLQKRSANKDSHPSCYDMSCAGHVSAGDDYLQSALRELQEELGVTIKDYQLKELFIYPIHYQKYFHNQLFIENEINQAYACMLDLETEHFILQEEEVESLRWVPFEQLESFMRTYPHCIIEDELNRVMKWVNNHEI